MIGPHHTAVRFVQSFSGLARVRFESRRRMPADRAASREVSWRQSAGCVSLSGAKADSPSPHDGPKHSIPEIGSRTLPRFVQTGDGEWLDGKSMTAVFIAERKPRSGGCTIATGMQSVGVNPRAQKTGREAQKSLRERLQARDNNVLEIVRKGESLSFGQWVDFFLENYSRPPTRARKTHQANLRGARYPPGCGTAPRSFEAF
jgi:hypothetical protein